MPWLRVGLLVLGMAALPARADTLELCTTLSFAPLEDNVPACTELIDDPGGLSDGELATVHAARAAALEFALTYHGEAEIDSDALLVSALADLDRAVALDASHLAERANILYRLGRFDDAAADITAAIAAMPDSAAGLLVTRSIALEASGDTAGSIDDMTAALRLAATQLERATHLRRRGELGEAAGDVGGAIGDYAAVLEISPGDRAALDALERLGETR